MRPFNEVRKFLLNPNDQSDRSDLAEQCAVISLQASCVTLVGMTGLVFGWMLQSSWPVVGSLISVGGGLAALLGRDATIIANNISNMLSDLPARVKASSSESQFVATITTRTWIAGPLFSASLVQLMKQQ